MSEQSQDRATAAEHTPGPWDQAAGWVGTPETTVATVKHQHDVALIAAAPALLEALVDVLDQLRAIGVPDWHGAEGLSLESADAAIAAARGGVK